MRLTALVLAGLFAVPGVPGHACASLVASVCPQDAAEPTMTARFIRMPVRPPAYAAGDIFPLADHNPLMNPERYDLPPAADGWRYYRIRPDVFRVDTRSGVVLEVVTGGNRRMLR
jgi:hypothetical protein